MQIARNIKSEALDAADDADEPLPPEYWALIAEAAVLAQLARADAAVGFLAGNVVVAEAQKAVRWKHRRIRQDVQARIQASRERAERPTTVPPWRSGHTVKLIEGDWKGRTGQVLETHLSENEPTMLTVQLFPAGLPVGPL